MYDTTTAASTAQIGSARPMESAILDRLTTCIQHGCVVSVEHADAVKPRFTHWETWGRPSCFNGDLDAIYSSIDSCRDAHADHHIRLSIESLTWRSRMSMVVHRPH